MHALIERNAHSPHRTRRVFRANEHARRSGALTGVVGSLQAMEVIKDIVGLGEGLVGRLLLYDARAARFETINYGWNPSNPLNGEESGAR